MIAQVRGVIAEKTGDTVTVMTSGGVGYDVAVPVGTLERLPDAGAEIQLHTVLVVKEDGWALFGFDRPLDKAVFERTLTASGVGPRLALALLSALGSDRVVRAVREGDLAALCTVSGVGKKKAERMILELKDRMGDLDLTGEREAASAAGAQAVNALVNLGYGHVEADDAVRAVLAAEPGAPASDVIRAALQQLARSR